MLTKSLIKYSIRGGKIFPKNIKQSDHKAAKIAECLIGLVEDSIGKRHGDLEDSFKQLPFGGDLTAAGMFKLLLDRSKFSEVSGEIETRRWEAFLIAKTLRLESADSLSEYQIKIGDQFGISFQSVADSLYGDLDSCRVLTSFKSITASELIHRYNLAQIQGLLCKAESLKITITGAEPTELRRLCQRLKFCQLLAEVNDFVRDGAVELKVSGPLAIFDQAQGYGLRLSKFVPYVLLFERWSLSAVIEIREKSYLLELDSKNGIKSHYKDFSGFIPEEFAEFKAHFDSLSETERQGWSLESSIHLINLGQGQFCVPDLSFRNRNGKVFHIELFHRWHQTQLLTRMTVLDDPHMTCLGLGVALELTKNPEIGMRISAVKSPGKKMFTFRHFPTIKAIMAQLAAI